MPPVKTNWKTSVSSYVSRSDIYDDFTSKDELKNLHECVYASRSDMYHFTSEDRFMNLYMSVPMSPDLTYDNNNRIQRRCSRIFTISSQRSELSPTHTLKWLGRNHVQIMCSTSNAYHVQVSCYVPLGTKGQLGYLVWQSWNRIYLSFILLAEPLNQWRRGGNRSTRRKPMVTSFIYDDLTGEDKFTNLYDSWVCVSPDLTETVRTR